MKHFRGTLTIWEKVLCGNQEKPKQNTCLNQWKLKVHFWQLVVIEQFWSSSHRENWPLEPAGCWLWSLPSLWWAALWTWIPQNDTAVTQHWKPQHWSGTNCHWIFFRWQILYLQKGCRGMDMKLRLDMKLRFYTDSVSWLVFFSMNFRASSWVISTKNP